LLTQDNISFSNGYDLIYSSISYGGMSGGPVFDTDGNVIGIHGKVEEANLNSLGISIQTFTGLAAKLRVTPNLLTIVRTNPGELTLEDRENVSTVMNNIPEPQAGDNGKRWLNYANQLYRISKRDKSVAAFDRAIAKGEVLMGSYGKALSLHKFGQDKLAKIEIDRAIAAVPTKDRADYYYFWKYQSLIFSRLGKYDEALKSIDTAILLQAKSVNGLEKDFSLLIEKALILQSHEDYPAAIAIYNEIIRSQPQVLAYFFRGSAKSKIGDPQGANVDYYRAIALNPKSVYASICRELINPELGDKQGAIINYDRAIALNSKDANAYYNRGSAKLEIGDKQEAIVDYDRAIALNPKHTNAYINRGNTKYKLGDKQAAIVDYNRAIALNPKSGSAYYIRGLIKANGLGDKQGGITDINKAADLFREQGRMDLYQEVINTLKWQGN
jgi:tetratricopeptide (TPR) repeat protein